PCAVPSVPPTRAGCGAVLCPATARAPRRRLPGPPPRRDRNRRGGGSAWRGFDPIPRGAAGRRYRRSPRLGHREDRPHLDRAIAAAGDACGDRGRLVEVPGLDQVVAAELLPGLGERPIGGDRLAALDADGGRGRGRLQRGTGLEMAALHDRVGEGPVLTEDLPPLRLAHRGPLLLTVVDQQHVFHGSSSLPCSRTAGSGIDTLPEGFS